MLDREAMSIGDAAKDRSEDGLVEILDLLAAHAHQVVVVLGIAGDVGRDMPAAFEATRHSTLDLRLERPIDGRQRPARMPGAQLLMELLRRDGRLGRRERLRDDHALVGEAPAA